MLRKDSIKAGIQLADQLGLRKLHISKELDDLINSGCSVALCEELSNAKEWVSINAEDVFNSYLRNGVADTNEHDKLIEAKIQAVAKGLAGITDLVSSVVNPFCNEVKSDILTEEKESLGHLLAVPIIRPNFGLNVTSVPIVEQLMDSHQIGELDYNAVFPDYIREAFKPFQMMSDAERASLFTSNHSGMDELTKRVIDHVSTNEYFDLYSPSHHVPGQIYLAWVFACWLIKNPPENIDQSLSEFTLAMTNLRNKFARSLKIAVEREARDLKNGKLFLSNPSVNLNEHIIDVNGDVYMDWVKQGGSPEALYGIILSRRTNVDVRSLTKYEEYVDVYNRFLQNKEARYRSGYGQLVMTIARRRFLVLMTKHNPDLIPAKVTERLNHVIENYRTVTPDNVDYWLRSVFVKAFYPNSGAMLFIDDLLKQTERFADKSIGEVSEITRANFIADYLVKMVTECQ